MMKQLLQSLLIIYALSLTSCDFNPAGTKEQTGVIHYEIKYVRNETNVPTFVLPKIMIMKFNKSFAKTTIDAFGFSLSYIYDLKHRKNYTMLQILEHKFYHEGDKDAYPCGFEEIAGMEIKPMSDTVMMQGLVCHKAIATLPFNQNDTFPVFYTKKFSIENPNRTIPYKDIEGILMQFNIRINKIEMQFKAKNIKDQEVSMDEFEVPSGYTLISREKMTQYIIELLDK